MKSSEFKVTTYNEISKVYFPSFIKITDDHGLIKMLLEYEGIRIEAEDRYPFFCLVKLRLELERKSLKILCYGAKQNVYPSGMSAIGYLAYEYELGHQATKLVNIFDPIKDVNEISTVAEQKLFRETWLQSLKETNR